MKPNLSERLSVFALMRKDKFESFDAKERKAVQDEFSVSDAKIRDPNSSDKLLDAKLIAFYI